MLPDGQREIQRPSSDEDSRPLSQYSNPPIFNLPTSVRWIAGATLLAHVARLLMPSDLGHKLVWDLAFVGARYEGPAGWSIEPLQLLTGPITYTLVHADAMHLFINVFMLLAFGTVVARRMSRLRFLLFYIVCGIASGFFWWWLNQGSDVILIGASGAISGMVGALGWISLHVPAMDRPGPFRQRSTALTFIFVWLGLNFMLALLPPALFGVGVAAIAWEAHLGGFIAGYILIRFLDGRGRQIWLV